MNMKKWMADMIASEQKTPLPILSFPVISLLQVELNDFILSSELQAEGMKRVVEELDMPAAISLMDLSLEAECFGSEIKFFDHEIPAVVGKLVHDSQEALDLKVPQVGSCRTKINLEAVKLAKERISDRPVFAGSIGPFSLTGRLMGVSEAVINVRRKPEMVKILLEKATEYLIQYILEYKKLGADGVMVAEPLAGLLAPRLAETYSNTYMKKIIEAVQDDSFAVIYHNCGESVSHMADSIMQLGAMGYHFGNAIDISKIVPKTPQDCLIMGNIDPAGVVKNGTQEKVYEETMALLKENAEYDNYLLSTGCDIPPVTSWENIHAMFRAAKDFYEN